MRDDGIIESRNSMTFVIFADKPFKLPNSVYNDKGM